jgi:hypothetical protein
MTTDGHIPPHTAETHDCAYNLFRHKCLPDIICAIPEDRPAPHFIESGRWVFEHPLRPQEVRPPGFDNKAAGISVRFNGFYLFYALTAAPALRTSIEFLGSL